MSASSFFEGSLKPTASDPGFECCGFLVNGVRMVVTETVCTGELIARGIQ